MTEPFTPDATATTSHGTRAWLAAIIIVAAILAAYANSFPGSFFFDDDDAILLNTSIRNLHAWRDVLWPPVAAGIGGRPFANLTFALNYAVGGYDVRGYHAVNLAIHVLTALLLFGLTRRTLLQPTLRERFGQAATGVATIVALLWGLHPIDTNITDYVSQRTEGMMAALYLLTLYAFVRSAEARSRGWAIVSVVACLLGMATKEGMVTAPLIVWLYDRTFLSGTFGASLRRHWQTYAGLAATWLLLAGLMASSKLSARGVGFGLGESGWAYALTECRSVVRYLELAVFPQRLVFDYGPVYVHHLLAALPSIAVLVAAIALTTVALWRAPAAAFAGAWFFIVLSPSSSVVPVVQQPCAENRPYLAFAGVAALIVALTYRAVGRWTLMVLPVAAAALGFATWVRNPVFSSELSVWRDTVAKMPANERAANNLGNALLKAGRIADAIPYFDRAIALSPNYADAHNNRGVTLLRQGKPADAVAEFTKAASCKPAFADAYYNLGEAYIQLQRPADAIAALKKSLAYAPDNPKAHNNLGIAYLDSGHIADSIAEEHRALALDPQMPEAHYNLGNSFSRAGQENEALKEFEVALRLDPRFARAHNNAGVALLHLGRPDQAAVHFKAALRIDPAYPEAKKNLALVGGHASE
jgi:protein O-mannosyl-transferase